MGLIAFARGFVEPARGNHVQLERFPGLFAMEGHAGASGFAFSVLWFVLATFFVPSIWTVGGVSLGLIVFVVVVAFVGLLYASFTASNYVVDQLDRMKAADEDIEDIPAWRAKLDRRVRMWMTLLSAGYVLVCCVLIWLTGGALSPFTPFYVMIFTLTITKIRVSAPGLGKWVLGYFLAAIFGACLAAEFLPSLIDGSTIRERGFQIAMHILFILFALIVPTYSQYRVEREEAKRLGRTPHPGGAPA